MSYTLELRPMVCPCGHHPKRWRRAVQGVHRPSVLCPLSRDTAHLPDGACCVLRAKFIVEDLAYFGELDLVEAMYRDLTAEEAVIVGHEFTRVVDEQRTALTTHPNEQASAAQCMERLVPLRQAARWFLTLGQLGFGARTSF